MRNVLRKSLYTIVSLGISVCFSFLIAQAASEKEHEKDTTADNSYEKVLRGKIEEVRETSLIIGDTVHHFAEESGLNGSSFAPGQYVVGEMDKKRRILSLQPEIPPQSNTNQQPAPLQPTIKQPLRQESGVWKN